MIWMRYLPHIALLSALAGGAWWYGEGRYDSGHRDGDKTGFKRGVDRTNELRDKEMAILIAESRADAEKVRREALDHARDLEARQRAEIASSERRLEEAAAGFARDRDRLLARLRRAQDSVRAANDPSRVPEAAGGGVPPAISAGALLAGGGEMVERLHDAELVNGWFDHCARAYRKIRGG